MLNGHTYELGKTLILGNQNGCVCLLNFERCSDNRGGLDLFNKIYCMLKLFKYTRPFQGQGNNP